MRSEALRDYIYQIFSVDLRTLALFRIALASLVLVNICLLWPDLSHFFTDEGIMPRRFLTGGLWNISMLTATGSLGGQQFLFGLGAVWALMLLVGYQTRLASFLTWFFVMSVNQRNPYILNGGDEILALIAFWGIFAPLGARFSIDSLRGHSGEKASTEALSLGTAALVLQMPLVYVGTAFLKNHPEWTTDFTAIFITLHLHHYYGWVSVQLRELPMLVLQAMTIGTLVLEYAAALILLPYKRQQIRLTLVLLFIGLQAGFYLCLWVGLFPFISTVAILPLLPSTFWEWLNKKAWWSELSVRVDSIGAPYRREGVVSPPSIATRVLRRSLSVVCAVALVLCLVDWYNATRSALRLPRSWELQIEGVPNPLREILTHKQYWAMFFGPGLSNPWYVFYGVLEDGSQVNLMVDGGRAPTSIQPVSFERLEYPNTIFVAYRWQKFFESLNAELQVRIRTIYADYMCRHWNTRFSGDKRLKRVKLKRYDQKIKPDRTWQRARSYTAINGMCERVKPSP